MRAYGDRDWSYSPQDFTTVIKEAGVTSAAVFGVSAHEIELDTPNEFVEDFCSQLDIETIPFMALDLSSST